MSMWIYKAQRMSHQSCPVIERDSQRPFETELTPNNRVIEPDRV